ncbi:hypothetical protein CR513_13294, partial [Mucuna pruriens]
MSAHLVPNLNQVGQSDPQQFEHISSSPPPPTELKPLLSHLKYAYLDDDQQLPIIIANNLHREILMEEEAHPIRQQQRRLNLTTHRIEAIVEPFEIRLLG